jgi:hypothetical protein
VTIPSLFIGNPVLCKAFDGIVKCVASQVLDHFLQIRTPFAEIMVRKYFN